MTIGGTEIMRFGFDQHILPLIPSIKKYNWCIVPGQNTLFKNKKNIGWIHIGYKENDVQQFKNREFSDLFHRLIFVSDWQYNTFWQAFNLRTERCCVIKNAIDPLQYQKRISKQKLKLVFHPEPWRGLEVLLLALRLIDDPDLEVHVFQDLEKMKHLPDSVRFDALTMAKSDKRVVVRGKVPNKQVRQALETADIFAYPSTFEETSCLALIEALSAGCACLTSNVGALPETGLGYAKTYGYIPNNQLHAVRFAQELQILITDYRHGKIDTTRQVTHTNTVYSWESRKKDWLKFVDQI